MARKQKISTEVEAEHEKRFLTLYNNLKQGRVFKR